MNRLKYKGYIGSVEISDEDNVFRVVVTFYNKEVKDSAGT